MFASGTGSWFSFSRDMSPELERIDRAMCALWMGMCTMGGKGSPYMHVYISSIALVVRLSICFFNMFVFVLELKTCMQRLINHFKYRSPSCRMRLLCGGTPHMSAEQADFLDQELQVSARELYARGLRRHKATMRAVRVQGPLEVNPFAELCSSSPLGHGRQHHFYPHSI